MPDDPQRHRPAFSEALLTSILDAALDAIITIDAEGAVLTWSAQAERMFGWPASDVVGRVLATTIIPERYRQQHERGLARMRAGGKPAILNQRIEITALHRNGHELPVELTVTRVPLGATWLFSAFVRDLTQQRRSEQEHRRTAEFLSAAQAVAHVGSWEWDVATNAVTWSDETYRLFGRLPGDGPVAFDSYLSLIHSDDRESVDAAINQALVSAGSFEIDHRVVHQDGSIRYLYGRGGVVSDASGKPTRMVGTVLDISARRQAEDELRRANDHLRTVIEASPLAIYTLDPGGFVQSWNPAAERLFGWTAQETIGRFIPVVPEDDLVEFMALRRRVLTGEQITGLELIRRKKDGSWLNVNLFAAPLRDAAGAVTGLLGVVEDVTAAKQLERQFFQAQKMEAVGRLAGGVAHDFNNLLTVILGGCDLLLMDEVSDLKRTDLQEIRQAATRAASLTGQLLAVSRQQVLAPQIVDLTALVEKVESSLGRLLGEDIKLLRVAGAELGTVAADPGQLEQVIMTLAVNARDAMPNGGTLTIETANVELDAAFAQSHPPIEPGFYVMLAVRDTGTGMDEHTRAHLFEPFFTTKQRGKGRGLGLSAVYGIVRQSGGAIDASNETEGGAAIRIYLPWVVGAAGEDPLSTPMPASLRGTETILLVEDDVQVRAITHETLMRYGYSVLEAADADRALALEQSRAGPLHLLITDVVLPRRSGAELATLLRARRPDLRVLFMSGYTDDVSLVRQASDSFLQKPFGPETLALKVRETLR